MLCRYEHVDWFCGDSLFLYCIPCSIPGQHDDARMNIALALTAAREGATVANHVEVTSLLKEQQVVSKENGDKETKQVLCGARLHDRITGKEWEVRSHVIVNATGPFTDHVRTMDNPDVIKICQPSAGVHIVLPSYYRCCGLFTHTLKI